jgi:hypothetical protein
MIDIASSLGKLIPTKKTHDTFIFTSNSRFALLSTRKLKHLLKIDNHDY